MNKEKNANLEAYYGLPSEVKFCSKCVMSNQRPASAIEFKHTKDSKKVTLNFDENNVCDACRTAEQKEAINWEKREEELIKLLDNCFNFLINIEVKMVLMIVWFQEVGEKIVQCKRIF